MEEFKNYVNNYLKENKVKEENILDIEFIETDIKLYMADIYIKDANFLKIYNFMYNSVLDKYIVDTVFIGKEKLLSVLRKF